MSITTGILAGVATSSSSGFHSATGTPANFLAKDDAGAYSDIFAYMGNVAGAGGTSNAVNRLNFATSFLTTPLATRTTRKIRVRANLIAHMHSSAPGGSSCKAGIRYSLNGGSSFTTLIEFNNTIPNTELNSSGFQIYEFASLSVSQDVTLIMIEAYCDANSGAGGGTANLSYANVQADWGIVEDFESGVNLLTIRPSASPLTNDGPVYGPSLTQMDPDNARDGIITTYSLQAAYINILVSGTTIGNLYQTATFATEPVPGGVIHAQLLWNWSGRAFLTDDATGHLNTKSTIQCEWSEFTGQPYSTSTDPKCFITQIGTSDGHSGDNIFTDQSQVCFVRDITALFREVSQVTMRMHAILTKGSANSFGYSIGVSLLKIYEMYMEIRVPSSSGGSLMSGWEPV